jgi:hypothetical protein
MRWLRNIALIVGGLLVLLAIVGAKKIFPIDRRVEYA